LSFPRSRIRFILVAAIVAVAVFATTAFAAKPKNGNYSFTSTSTLDESLNESVEFKVAKKKMKQVKIEGVCGNYELPKAIHIKRSGKFEFSGDLELGSQETSVFVDGKFGSKKEATGSVTFGACGLYELNFVAKKGGNDVIVDD
jgi:hypothetical protein